MSRAPRLWMICYDIRDDARLRHVYKIMRGYGDRVQYSVFRCVLSDLQLARLREKLEEAVKATEDQVLLVPLGSADSERAWRHETIGVALPPVDEVVRIL